MILLTIIAFVLLIVCGFWSFWLTLLSVFGIVSWKGKRLYGINGLPIRLLFLGIAAILAIISHLCYNFLPFNFN